MVGYPRVSLRFTLGYLLAFPTGLPFVLIGLRGLTEEIFKADPSLRSQDDNAMSFEGGV